MSSISCTKLTLFTIGAIIIQFIGLSIFVFGFFPVKPTLSGHSGSESFQSPTCDNNGIANQSDASLSPDRLKLLYQEASEIPPSYDRLIIMVIDGLPAEFVLGKKGQPPGKAFMEAMPYTQSLLAKCVGVGYHAIAAAPTVTMPRLKAMVSGAIGGFLDVAFNFNTQAYLDDNLLAQFFRSGQKMVMHGDDTWLKLFPGLFHRHDGVNSFFVKDTVQVDQNVSRHLNGELSRDDWDFLILHYLGLDHVGHTGGRNSVLMASKLSEMDEVVKMIHMNTLQNLQNGQGQTLLVIVSDHGMTENGNHGGSSYEETDSLALFISPKNHACNHALSNHNTVFQVDIAPTLALLFGVPIPKNNVGVLIPQMIDSMTDVQKLRALQLNSWQLFRLLQAQLPGLSCRNFPCDAFVTSSGHTISECKGSMEKLFCFLYLNAATAHDAWKAEVVTRSNSTEGYNNIVAAYHEFLSKASEWLSHKATDKPINLLLFGVAALITSCLILLRLVFVIHKDVSAGGTQDLGNYMKPWKSDEVFILFSIMILVISMGSSSMIEEEHYIWHFLTSTISLLFLRKAVQSFECDKAHGFLSSIKTTNNISGCQMGLLFLILCAGRILRGWHQGGVNWTNLPDISKWLEQADSHYINLIQIASCVMIIILGISVLYLMGSKTKVKMMIGSGLLMSGFLVLHHFMKHQDMSSSYNKDAIISIQIFYAILGITTVTAVLVLPWIMHIKTPETCSRQNFYISTSAPLVLKDSLYVVGCVYITSWCLLQLLLQQPINAMPVLLLFVQVLASMLTFSFSGSLHKQWVEIAMLYNLGMAGHFALGNSNTLATIDVAGAFIGISSQSNFLSGLLMFIITYASPMLFFLSMVLCISLKVTDRLLFTKDECSGEFLKPLLGFPCLVPLSMNSVLLTAFTIVILLMRNHLFIWSVFSPKYLYVCAATACVYVGVFIVFATVVYTYMVLFWLRRSSWAGGMENGVWSSKARTN
ncbi:PREDICTED: GPI ethanolamine phosphate transferase 2 isoform X1 [Lupinus angustifolius]|uniref:GPI ethanolamine phosphate transferase 2 isoform X1 n=1 Tax=Lupinus angustifolius TaxID=3871 RepID=UPI00092E523A|nr:PREDICTED: GPI ethanolamine phosphate transferase 2 isoform X1 [Lupinus angustifolius]XP_019445398.1 PREDICTED: GPI ethanolamine phosphate transferase 2 isoform X1 [Lupinus angustifolius]